MNKFELCHALTGMWLKRMEEDKRIKTEDVVLSALIAMYELRNEQFKVVKKLVKTLLTDVGIDDVHTGMFLAKMDECFENASPIQDTKPSISKDLC